MVAAPGDPDQSLKTPTLLQARCEAVSKGHTSTLHWNMIAFLLGALCSQLPPLHTTEAYPNNFLFPAYYAEDPTRGMRLLLTIESFELEGTINGPLVQLPCNEQRDTHTRSAAQSPVRPGTASRQPGEKTPLLVIWVQNTKQRWVQNIAAQPRGQLCRSSAAVSSGCGAAEGLQGEGGPRAFCRRQRGAAGGGCGPGGDGPTRSDQWPSAAGRRPRRGEQRGAGRRPPLLASALSATAAPSTALLSPSFVCLGFCLPPFFFFFSCRKQRHFLTERAAERQQREPTNGPVPAPHPSSAHPPSLPGPAAPHRGVLPGVVADDAGAARMPPVETADIVHLPIDHQPALVRRRAPARALRDLLPGEAALLRLGPALFHGSPRRRPESPRRARSQPPVASRPASPPLIGSPRREDPPLSPELHAHWPALPRARPLRGCVWPPGVEHRGA